MKIKQPEPFTFKAGKRAVLLLHGFTGHSADVRMLGRFLERKNYTSHAPIYRGHGKTPEDILAASPDEWWEDVQEAYQYLRRIGHDEIAVIGLSMGGALGLKLANTDDVKAVIPMCTPMFFDNEEQLTKGFKQFAKQYKQLEKKDQATITQEIDEMFEVAPRLFQDIGRFITDISKQIDTIYSPTMVVQARKDEMINPESATYIYENVQSHTKEIKWYEESGHVITLGQEREQLHKDIYEFLESLPWTN